MDDAWERAVESALEGQTDPAGVRTLTLDGAVKCLHGRLPPPSVLEKFQNIQQLSIANIGVSSLEQFPRLRKLQKLILSDNRIAGGLEFLVEAGLDSLRDLDLSNNRMQYIEDLAPLAQLRLVSLDLYECPVTRVKDYRSRVFGLIKSLKYLDKMDAEENERPESDEDDEDDDEEEEDDPGSGEVDGDERPFEINNRHSEGGEGIVDVEEDEESDADEETETGRSRANGSIHQANGFRIGAVGDGEVGDEDEEDGEDEDDGDDSGEEVDDDEGDDDDDDDDNVVEVHEIDDSDDEEDGVEDDDEEEEDDDEEEEVDNEDGGISDPRHQGRLGSSVEGEIDGHEQGEDDEDGDGETGEEEQEVEEDVEFEEDEDGEEEEEDYGAGYLVQPVSQVVQEDAGASNMDPGNKDVEHEEVEEAEEEEEEVDDEKEVQEQPPSSSYLKRKRDGSGEEEDEEDDEDEDVIEFAKSSSKKHH